jgi:hypothetical protein
VAEVAVIALDGIVVALRRMVAPVVVTVAATSTRAGATPTAAVVTDVKAEMMVAGEMMTASVATARRTPMAAGACSASKLSTVRVVHLLERMTRSWRSCPKEPELLTSSFCLKAGLGGTP